MNLPRSEMKELDGQRAISFALLTTTLSATPDGSMESFEDSDEMSPESQAQVLQLLNSEEIEIVLDHSTMESITRSFLEMSGLDPDIYLRPERGARRPAPRSVLMGEKSSIWKHVICRIAGMFSRKWAALMSRTGA